MTSQSDNQRNRDRAPEALSTKVDQVVGIDVGALLGTLIRRAWLIAIATMVGAGLGFAWHQLSTPWYESVTVLAPVEGDLEHAGLLAGPMGLANLVGVAPASRVSRKDEAIATLKSRAFLVGFVEDLELMRVLFSVEQGAIERLLPEFLARPPSPNDAVDLLQEQVIKVVDDRRTGLIQIRVTWSNPETTVHWALELVDRVNKEMQASARDRAAREMEFLQKELERNPALEVRQAIFRLMETQLKTMMLANVSDEFALRVIDPPVAPDPDQPVSLSLMARMSLAGFLAALLATILVLVRAIDWGIRA